MREEKRKEKGRGKKTKNTLFEFFFPHSGVLHIAILSQCCETKGGSEMTRRAWRYVCAFILIEIILTAKTPQPQNSEPGSRQSPSAPSPWGLGGGGGISRGWGRGRTQPNINGAAWEKGGGAEGRREWGEPVYRGEEKKNRRKQERKMSKSLMRTGQERFSFFLFLHLFSSDERKRERDK